MIYVRNEDKLSYFIIGPARCGKSTLAKRLHKETGLTLVPIDAMLAGLKVVADPNENDAWGEIDDTVQTYDEWLGAIKQRDDYYARFISEIMVSSVKRQGTPLIVDSILWPHHVAEINVPAKVVVLVDTSEKQYKRLMDIDTEKGDYNHWKEDWSEERFKKWSKYNARRSKEFVKQAKDLGYPVVDIADFPTIKEASDAAFNVLLDTV